MSESTLAKIGSHVWGFVVGAVALVFFGCIFFNIVMELLSLGLWLLPLPLAFGTLVIFAKQTLHRERVYGTILSVGAMLCFPWASLIQNYGPTLPTWLQIILTYGFSSEPVQGPRGPEIYDLGMVMGFAAIASVVGTISLIVVTYNVVKERLAAKPPESTEQDEGTSYES